MFIALEMNIFILLDEQAFCFFYTFIKDGATHMHWQTEKGYMQILCSKL